MSEPSWLRRAAARIGLDLIALGVFSLGLATLAIVYGGRWTLYQGSVLWPLGVLLVLLAINLVARWRGLVARDPEVRAEVRRRVLTTVRDWLPLILLIFVYQNLRAFTGLIRTDSIDLQLWALDVKLFGVEPVLFAQRFADPWLTDWFAFTYTLYFIIPLTMVTTLYLRGHREDFREVMLGVVAVMYGGFIMFIIFPAGPPRFCPEIMPLFDPPKLTGKLGFFEATTGGWDRLNPDKVRASFPSLHCALSATALFYTWRFRRALGGRMMFFVFLPLVVSLWISTVYLRHHWIVDCFAGIALATVVFIATPYLRRWYSVLGSATGASPPSPG
ncbi:MAG: inositol phosphorylceramide synthase [Deltaproteobacteria bacterium]|nr:inositol phosphorylceramide synthase [Deltaproteobacteria bacterium]